MFTPVTNAPSSLARNRAALAMSIGSVSRPSGTLLRNLATFSSVYGTPTKVSKRPVPDSNGQMALTLICEEPNSEARPLVAWIVLVVGGEDSRWPTHI